MDKQTERLILRIDKDLKIKFKEKSSKEYLNPSAKIKFLMHMYIEDKIIIKQNF